MTWLFASDWFNDPKNCYINNYINEGKMGRKRGQKKCGKREKMLKFLGKLKKTRFLSCIN